MEQTTESSPKEQEPGKFDELVNGVNFIFKRLEERKPGEAWILLYYGASGSGKTYFAGTAGPRTLFINIGFGIDTLMSPAFTERYPDARRMITVDINERIGTEKDPTLLTARAFDLVTDVIDHALKHFPDAFDTVAIDDATFLRKIAMNKAMELLRGSSRDETKRTVNLADYVKPELPDFGEEMRMIEWFLATYIPILKEQKKNLIMTAHQRQIYGKPPKMGDEAPLKRVLPGFTGKTFPDQVPAYFDDVFYAEVIAGGPKGQVYRARTAGNSLELGKARHGGVFPTVISNPNFLEMLAKIRNSY